MVPDDNPGVGAREIEGRIIAFMRRELLSREVTVNPDDDLLSGGLLDSVGVLRLATFVTEEFEFEMQPADFVIENFQSVSLLAAYVRRAADHPGRPPAEPGR